MAPVIHDVRKRDATLHLPRILCLHCRGTNAHIFQMQCRVIKTRLSQSFRLVFAQAPFPAAPGPDVISVYSKFGPFRAWLHQRADDAAVGDVETAKRIKFSLSAAIAEDNLRGATGDVVGLLGFSQGAKVAASLLYAQQLCQQRLGSAFEVWPEFHFAALLAGRGPLIWLMPETMPTPPGLLGASELSSATLTPLEYYLSLNADEDNSRRMDKLRLPTIHVHGLKDANLRFHRDLCKQYCHSDAVTLIEWYGEHRVPIKTGDVDHLIEEIHKIAEAAGF